MGRLLRRSGTRYLTRHPWQLLLAVGGVGLGVAVAVAVALATASAKRAFVISSETLTGQTTHQIVGGSAGLPDELYRQLRVDLGIRASAPVVEGFVVLSDTPDRAIRLLGVDPLAEIGIRDDLGAAPGGSDELPLTRLIGQSGTVVAADASLPASGTLRVLVDGRTEELTILGRLRSEAEGYADVLIADIATAQETLGMVGRLTRIDLRLEEDPQVTIDRVEAILPGNARLLAARARADSTVQMTQAFELNLRAMSLLAVLCGAFLIYNTMTFSVVQRREQFGALRALGVTRREILTMVLREAAVIGTAGTVLGILGGIVLGNGLVRLVARTVNDLYFAVTVQRLELPPETLITGLLLGLVGTLAAAAVPACEATRVPARIAITRSVLEERAGRWAPWLAALGLAMGGVGMALALARSGGLIGAFAGLFVVVVGASFAAPLAVQAVGAASGRVLRRVAGVPGLMAARGLTAGLSRTAVAVAALAIAVSVIVGVGVMVSSFRTTLVGWLEHTLAADVYVSPVTARGVAPTLAVSPAQVDAVRNLPGVLRTRSIRAVSVETDDGTTMVLAVEHEAPDNDAYRLRDGNPAAAWEAFDSGAVIASEPYAERLGVGPGDTVVLPTPAGEREFDVAGVFFSYASDRGALLMARSTYDRFWDDDGISGLSIYLAEGASAAAAAPAIREALAPTLVTVVSNTQLREESLIVFDRTFLITGVLRILVTLVAFVGVMGAVLALQLERTREYAMLRANGFTPGQLRSMVVWQSALLGAASGVLALPLGWVLAWLMIHVINKRSFGWTLLMTVPPSILVQAFLVAIAAAVIAGLYPAQRIALTPPALAMREDR
jgi:putative ABC transport system permease protein